MNSDVDPNFDGDAKKCKISFAEGLGECFFQLMSLFATALWFLLYCEY
jgi:hypothetical protein